MKKPSPSAPAFANRNLPLLLLQARESVIRRFRPLLNANGVTEQQWRILRVVAERGPTEPRDLVHLCAITSPSLTGILARMDDLGLVKRERVESDQRRLLVSITPKSRALVSRLAPKIDAVYAQINEVLGREFNQRFYDALDRLVVVLADGENEPAKAMDGA
ncbi:MAG: homoprotocatechuate degradation operon regulator HpaR [Ramlibacter sp.]